MYALLGTYTFSSLPVATSVVAGTQAFCSDLGMVYSNGNAWLPFTSFAPVAPTGAAVQAAINAAAAAGGGVVQLPAGVIQLTVPLIPASGVAIRGVVPGMNYGSNPNTIPDSWLVGPQGGTIINCAGGDGFAWNLTPLGVPASQLAFTLTGLSGFEISGIGFTNFRNGINAGATNNCAALYAKFFDLFGQSASGWLVNITNFQHCNFARLRSFGGLVGQMFFGNDVPAATLQPGNSTFEDLFGVTGSGSNLIRGICHNVNQGTQNQATHSRIQMNKLNASTVTQAATMVNTQSNITITDGTKFAINVPVSFTTTANGFTANKIYFVLSVVGNVVTVANTVGGAAVTATGNTAINMVTQGFAPLELVALAGSQFTNQTMTNIDVEGGGTCAILMQNKSGMLMNISQLPQTSQSTQGVCCRGVVNSTINASNGTNTDFDNSAPGAALTYNGQRTAGCVGFMGNGTWYDTVSGNAFISMGCVFDTQGNAMFNLVAGNKLFPGSLGLGQKAVLSGTANQALGDSQLNNVYTNNVSGTGPTLPQITATNLGMWATLANFTAAAQTFTTTASQLINNVVARTTIVINPNASARLVSGNGPSGGFCWWLDGGSSAMVAGVISAPS